MKAKVIFIMLLALLSNLVMLGCSDNDEGAIVSKELQGTWKCIGLGNTQTKKMGILEPMACEKCYVLTLKSDRTFEAYSSTNTLYGSFCISKNTFKFESIEGTEVGELGDGVKFIETLKAVVSYEVDTNLLLLYYTNTEYLIFKRKK